MAPRTTTIRSFCLFVVILLFAHSAFNNYAVELKRHGDPASTAFHPISEGVRLSRCTNSTNTSIESSSMDRSSDTLEITSQYNKTDWFQGELWKSMCFEVEHVCHSTNRWWYKEVANAHQPNFRFLAHKQYKAKVGYPLEIEVKPATREVENLTCTYSPIPNHLVLFGLYNEMLGEFYSRNLVGLAYMMSKEENMKDLLVSTQLYLHLNNFDRSLLDSHYAFMAPFLSHRLLNFKELLQSTSCSCAERMVFCGYKFEEEDGDVLVKGAGGLEPKRIPGVAKNDPELFRGAQRFIRENVIINNPLVQKDIADFRKRFLIKKGIKANFDDWKIIGLAQRSGRRRWLNIDDSIRTCEEEFRRKHILCIVVNVEEHHFHPTHHVVVHAAMDGLIGIHGAQLTNALWMKPGSIVVELLPYLTHNMKHGDWTRKSKEPTPLGEIFIGTDLQHVGLPLKWTSVPQCETKQGQRFEACVKRIGWAERDFHADKDDVKDVIDKFARDRPNMCLAQQALAGRERFVLYNALCDDGGVMGAHTFYWDRGLEEIEAFSGFPK